jgi:hypothetical protein
MAPAGTASDRNMLRRRTVWMCGVGYPSGHDQPADDQRDPALIHNTLQVMAPGAQPLLFTTPDALLPGPTVVDRAGRCVFHQDGMEDSIGAVYDLERGTKTPLLPVTDFAWF